MMHSICLDDDDRDADREWQFIEHGYAGARTPSTASDHPESETEPQPQQYEDTSGGSDEEYGGSTQVAPRKKKGGYDSRIEQILYENPDLPILIVEAGKSLESGGKYIVYTIRTGVRRQPPFRAVH
jgi:sorting nexin-41/42